MLEAKFGTIPWKRQTAAFTLFITCSFININMDEFMYVFLSMLSRKKKVDVKIAKEVFFWEDCDMLELCRIWCWGKQDENNFGCCSN